MTQELGKKQSPYKWCLEHNVRPFNPEKWGEGSNEFSFGHFHETMMSEEDFLNRLKDVKYKNNSRPRKMNEFLAYRMYGMVIYQLKGIQQGIQFQHSTSRYVKNLPEETNLINTYNWWMERNETSIILNGGSTNNNLNRLGTINVFMNELIDNGIHVEPFYEIDLNDALTAFSFVVDERVFLKEDYPDYKNSPYTWDSKHTPNDATYKKWEDDNAKNHKKWVEKIGGEQNAFLREFLIGKRLA